MKRIVNLFFHPRHFELWIYERIGIPFLGRYFPNGGSRFRISKSFLSTALSREHVLRKFINKTLFI